MWRTSFPSEEQLSFYVCESRSIIPFGLKDSPFSRCQRCICESVEYPNYSGQYLSRREDCIPRAAKLGGDAARDGMFLIVGQNLSLQPSPDCCSCWSIGVVFCGQWSALQELAREIRSRRINIRNGAPRPTKLLKYLATC